MMARLRQNFPQRNVLRSLILTILIAIMAANCGFLRNARVSKEYINEMAPDSPEECLVTWPFHVILIPIMAIIDQTIHTFEIVPEAYTDASDYFLLRGTGNNVMLEFTIAVPKTLVTPVIFVTSYISRWFFPFDDDYRPFEMDLSASDDHDPEKEESEPPTDSPNNSTSN